MTSLPDLLASVEPIDGGFRTRVPDNWLQGRTAYGGLSSALAVHAAMLIEPDLPPLRTAQIAFIGPLSGEITVTAQRLRRGRNAAFLQADIVSEAGLGYRAMFVFMAGHTSRLNLDETPRSTVAPPAPDETLWRGMPGHFTQQLRLSRPQAEGADGTCRTAPVGAAGAARGAGPGGGAAGDRRCAAARRAAAARRRDGAAQSSINWQVDLLTAKLGRRPADGGCAIRSPIACRTAVPASA